MPWAAADIENALARFHLQEVCELTPQVRFGSGGKLPRIVTCTDFKNQPFQPVVRRLKSRSQRKSGFPDLDFRGHGAAQHA